MTKYNINDSIFLNVIKPVETAKGLPNKHYVNKRIFLEEQNHLFLNKWVGLGFAKNVPNLGDVYPLIFLKIPLLIVRDRDNRIRVFQNTCRHRGMILIKEKSNVRGTIRCPYHSWCYNLDGTLRSTPHVNGPGNNIHKDIRRNELGLYEIPAYEWQGIIFINFLGKAPNFQDHFADLIIRWKDFDQKLFHSGKDSSIKLVLKCNWKLAVENYCESYHLPWIHPGLNSYSKLEDHYNIEHEGKYSGQGSKVYSQLEKNGMKFSDFHNLSAKWQSGAEYIALFPNVLLGVHRDHAFSIILEPVNKAKTIEHIEIFYPSKTSLLKKFSSLRAANRKQWETVFKEDISVVEGMQKGRKGIFFDGGKFSPKMDGPTHVFHQWVANSIIEREQD